MLSDIPGIEDIALTTNGTRLSTHCSTLKKAGLHRVTVSLDALDSQIFKQMSDRDIEPQAILDGIDNAVKAGLPVKVNMVVKKGTNEQEILPMARYFKERQIPLRFIEFMDVGNRNKWNLDEVYPARKILEDIEKEFPLKAVPPKVAGEVARYYQFEDSPSQIGIISSVTQPFCQSCNRSRISSNGLLYTCLFAEKGFDLKQLLRSDLSDSEIEKKILGIWKNRTDRYSEKRTSENRKNKVEMNFIGG